MSNHHHLLIRDEHGNYPEFLAHLHKMIAKAMNAYLGRKENFWSSEQPSVVPVIEASDLFAKLLYILANPVAADLVEHVADWPGAVSLTQMFSDRSMTVERPNIFFREEGPMPESAQLRAERVPGLEHLGAREWEQLVMSELQAKEECERIRRREQNKRVLGRKGVLRTDPMSRPTTEEPPGEPGPRIACKNKERREHEIGLLAAFRSMYRAALALWRGGDHSAEFPEGTYRMRWFGARVAGAT